MQRSRDKSPFTTKDPSKDGSFFVLSGKVQIRPKPLPAGEVARRSRAGEGMHAAFPSPAAATFFISFPSAALADVRR